MLGHVVGHRGSVMQDFREVKQQVIGVTLRNFGSHVCRAVSQQSRLRLLDRVARSSLDYRNTRWPLSPVLIRAQDSLQRRCVAIACGCPRRPHEDIGTWQRRRSRNCGEIAKGRGLWSERHGKRLLDWRAHVERSAAHGSLMSHVWHWHDASWRQSQRERAGSSSFLAGRLGARVLTHVHTRWQDSLPDNTISGGGARLPDGSHLIS